MYVMRTTGRCALLLLGALSFAGTACAPSKHECRSEAPAPPPPPQRVEAPRTFSYPHPVNPEPERKLVIGLVRFAEDRAIEDAPFGQLPTENGEPELVEVNVGTVESPPPSRQAPGLSPRHRQILKRELLECGAFVVVERDGILDILREINFGESRYVDPQTSPEVGEIMAVQYLLEGSVGPNEDVGTADFAATAPPHQQGAGLAERVFCSPGAATQARLRELQQMRLARARQQHYQDLEEKARHAISVYLSLYDVRTSEIAAQAYGNGSNALEAFHDAVEDLVDECRGIP